MGFRARGDSPFTLTLKPMDRVIISPKQSSFVACTQQSPDAFLKTKYNTVQCTVFHFLIFNSLLLLNERSPFTPIQGIDHTVQKENGKVYRVCFKNKNIICWVNFFQILNHRFHTINLFVRLRCSSVRLSNDSIVAFPQIFKECRTDMKVVWHYALLKI